MTPRTKIDRIRMESDARTLRGLKEKLRLGDIDRRSFLAAAGALSGTALLAGCGGGGGPQGPGVPGAGSGVVPLYTVENDPATLACYNMAIDNFKQEHPDIDVEVTVYSDSNQAQYLVTAFQNNVDVGIFSPAVSDFVNFAGAGHLMELDDLITEIGEDDFMPATRIRVSGHDYGMPLQNNSSLVYYRKDLLEGAGLEVPTTFDQYLGAIEELGGGDVNGIAMAVGSTAQLPLQFFAPYLYQAGADYFDSNAQLTFDKPEALTAVEKFIAVMRNAPDSLYNAAFGDIVTTYAAGQAAFATFPGRMGVNLYNDYPEIAEKTGVMRIPAGDYMTGELHFGSGQQYGLYSGTAEPEMAKAFLKQLTTGDDAVEFAKTVPGHLLPALKSVREKFEAELESATEGYLGEKKEWIQTFMDAVPQAMTASTAMGVIENGEFGEKHTNINPFAQNIWPTPALDGVMFQEILIDGRDTEEAWTDCCDKMRKVADDFHAANPDWEPEIV